MDFRFREEPLLPRRTISASLSTARWLRGALPKTSSINIVSDDELPDDLILFSEDMFRLAERYLEDAFGALHNPLLN